MRHYNAANKAHQANAATLVSWTVYEFTHECQVPRNPRQMTSMYAKGTYSFNSSSTLSHSAILESSVRDSRSFY